MLSETFKKRLQFLGGIKNLNEKVELIANSGRSDKNTLGFFVEEYILNLGSIILENLDASIGQIPNTKLVVFQSETTILNNVLNISFEIQRNLTSSHLDKTKFNLSLLVNMNDGLKTTAMLKYKTLNDQFNLDSKHSFKDIQDFSNEIKDRILNTEKLTD